MDQEQLAKIDSLIKRETAKKESLFRRVQTLNDMISGLDKDPEDSKTIKAQNQFLISARMVDRSQFEAVLDRINDLELAKNPDFSPNYEGLISFDSIHGNILTAKDKILALRNKTNVNIDDKDKSGSSFNPFFPGHHFKRYANLPPLEIKHFSGLVTEWPSYRDVFTSLIINNPILNKVDKLHYLNSTVSGRPADIIKGFSLSDENFELAWKALEDRYESDRVLASHYFDELIKPVSIPAKPSIDSLQSFITQMNDNASGLKKMQLTDLADFLLFSLAIRNLDPVTRKEFENKNGSDNIPTFDSLIKYVKSECRLLEITTPSSTSSFNYRKTNSDVSSRTNAYKTSSNRKVVLTTTKPENVKHLQNKKYDSKSSSSTFKCPQCDLNHQLYHCPQFLNLSVSERHAFIKKNNLCYNCTGGHSVSNCKSTRSCFCNRRHHSLLHFHGPKGHVSPVNITSPENKNVSDHIVTPPQPISKLDCDNLTSKSDINVCATVTPHVTSSVVLLGTACAVIQNVHGHFIKFRLLIDCASTITLITRSLVDKLGLPVQSCTQTFSGLSNNSVGTSSGKIKCLIKPIHQTHPRVLAHPMIVDSILQSVPLNSLPASSLSFIKGLQLADPEFYHSRPVDMLVGCDLLPQILLPLSTPPQTNEITVLPTIFGHIIIGTMPVTNMYNSFDHFNKNVSLLTYPCSSTNELQALNKSVERFWETENISDKIILNPDDDYCEQHFVETHKRDSTGRYIVKMPFKVTSDKLIFPESKNVALQRFFSQENRFRKHPKLKEDCTKFLKEYENLGHMKKSTEPGAYFVPYFCVFNPNSPTTPTRVVFDGSAKNSSTAINEVLFSGPKLQNEVPDVILNFRINKLVFCCDISKMYRQILLDESQRKFVHIFFREEPSKPLIEYELCTVTYGLSPSSYLSHRVLVQLIKDEGHQYPLAVSVIKDNSIVDDIFAGSDSIEGLLEIKTQLCSLLASAGFPLNKWISNCPEFVENLQNSNPNTPLVVRNSEEDNIKVLGIGWDPKTDVFFFYIDSPPLTSTYTKRQVLSTIARIYDPLGFAAPTIFLFKCLLKEIWLSGVGWDDPLSPSLATQWHQYLLELPKLSSMKIPRLLFPSKPVEVQLLGFCDGSLKGSAAVLYLRVQLQYQVKIFMLKSKTKVAPSKVQTVPRLELIGALLLSKLVFSIKPFLSKLPVNNYKIFLFTDSTIVLSWIKKPPHLLKLYISNRVVTILENTSVSDWHHILTHFNISDPASRGLTPLELISNIEWFQGPKWAYEPIALWPKSNFDVLPLENLPEVKPIKTSILITSEKCISPTEPPPWAILFSNLSKMQRVVAYCLRFIHNTRYPNNPINSPIINSLPELNHALKVCIRGDQAFYFQDDLKCLYSNKPCSNKIQSLSPFIDKTGLLRVGGRLVNSNLNYNAKHPILLSNQSQLTKCIVQYYHKIYLHAGCRTLQALIFREYWIINCRQVIRKVIYSCVTCARFRNSVFTPPMGNLPSFRITPDQPFNFCSVDLAGPYTLKESLRRNAKTYKSYFALFICCTVKAVHLEVLTSLSTDCFISALTRFVSRRGKPANIYCDQGTNFRGASRQLREIVEFLRSSTNNEILLAYFSEQRINFHFNVPKAPFMNGIAESNIKNTKFHLTRAIGNQVLTFEEFSTITTRIEAILNSRPLCSISNSPNDLESLTPGHFLIGKPLCSVPEANIEHVPTGRLDRWQLVSQISQSLWRRWEREYLHTLQNKTKWFDPAINPVKGQLVWLKEDNSPPLSYPLGRICEIHPGSDGIVRAVTVRTGTGTYRRPVRRLAPLPIS